MMCYSFAPIATRLLLSTQRTITLDHLLHIIHTESDASNAEVEAAWQLPLTDRIQAGLAIADIQVVSTQERSIDLRFRENLSKFKVGDTLRLLRGGEGQIVRVVEEHRNNLIVSPANPYHKVGKGISGPGWVLDPAKVDLRDQLRAALGRLPDARRDQVLGWIGGTLTRRQGLATLPPPLQQGTLERQRQALALALGSTDPTLIQGPPGTGKTWLLARLVCALVAEGKRVLLTAFTHRAVHNALLAVRRAAPNVRLAKLGHPSMATELPDTMERLGDRDALQEALSSGRPLVVGATTHAATLTMDRIPAKAALFEHVVMDEASQVSLPFGVAALCRGTHATLLGDHKQMGPVILGTYHHPHLAASIFERLWIHQPGIMLDITHRMNREVCAWPSRAYYEGALKPSPEAASRRLQGPPRGTGDVLDPDRPDVFISRPVDPGGEPFRSPMEAAMIADLVQRLIGFGVSGKEIAVIAPFRVQVRAIREALSRLAGRAFEDVTVDTVERIQGQERDVVIFSLTVDAVPEAAEAQYHLSANRVNVAITRARVKRLVIGNAKVAAAIGVADR